MSDRVNHGGDDHELLFFECLVNYAIRESLWITPTNVLGWMLAAVQQGIYFKGIEYVQYLSSKLVSKTGTLSVIPLCCFNYVVFRLRPRNDLPPHDFDRERRRRFISSSDTEESGSERCAARRASTNSSSAADKGGSSNSNARRIRICRSSKVSSGSSAMTSLKLMIEA